MFQERGGHKRQRTDGTRSPPGGVGGAPMSGDDDHGGPLQNGVSSAGGEPRGGGGGSAEHSMRVMQGLNKLKRDRVLCDVTLIAEGERFDVHKVILVSCSDYFLSMFTSGMKESSQREIELKGVTSKGLEKVIEVIYTSTTSLEGDDIFDVIAAATHLQATPVIEFCERNFLSGMTTGNFYEFIATARLYSMTSALRQIDTFIAQHLLQIAAHEGALTLLTYEQMLACLQYGELNLKEIDIFQVVWDWLRLDAPAREAHAPTLVSHVRFPLIGPTDLVSKVQGVEAMLRCAELRELVLSALNYHVVPHAQPLRQGGVSTTPRCSEERVVSVGGREIHPHPGLHDDVFALDRALSATSLANRTEVTRLPAALSHMQVVVFGGFLYVLGGCSTQCAHGESAVNSVLRYDPRFNVWFQAAPMQSRRAYFYAGLVADRIYAVGGKFKDGSLASVEAYDAERDVWNPVRPLPFSCHAHAGAVLGGALYVSGGYSNNHFTPDLQRYDVGACTWDDRAPLLTARGWHVMAALQGRLIVVGGCNLNASQQALPVLQAECYDPVVDQWTLLSPLGVSHKEASCVVLSDQLYVLGGYNVQTKTGQKSVSRYDAYSGAWETVGTLPQSQTGVGYCVLRLPLGASGGAGPGSAGGMVNGFDGQL